MIHLPYSSYLLYSLHIQRSLLCCWLSLPSAGAFYKFRLSQLSKIIVVKLHEYQASLNIQPSDELGTGTDCEVTRNWWGRDLSVDPINLFGPGPVITPSPLWRIPSSGLGQNVPYLLQGYT